jgi:hypothetical protein
MHRDSTSSSPRRSGRELPIRRLMSDGPDDRMPAKPPPPRTPSWMNRSRAGIARWALEDTQRTVDVPPGPSENLGLKWVARFFSLAGYMSVVLLIWELLLIRIAADTDSVSLRMISHAVITGAAGTGFLRTANQLLERRKSGGIMAAIGCSLLIVNSLRPVVDALPLALGVVGLIVLASAWRKLD